MCMELSVKSANRCVKFLSVKCLERISISIASTIYFSIKKDYCFQQI